MTDVLLVVDDDASLCYSLKRVLKSSYEVLTASEKSQALLCLENHRVDLVLLDYRLGNENGLEILEEVKASYPQLPVIMMTAFGTNETIIEAMGRGAVDYLVKPVDVSELKASIAKYLKKDTSCDGVKVDGSVSAGQFIGSRSRIVRELLKSIPLIARNDSPVLICGESGTGKEVIARLIHQSSLRHGQTFLATNCAAIPENLLESELFGYKKGAFTGATRDKQGKLVTADGGTLFLDEVGDIALGLQPKLLRALQEQKVEPLGSNQTQPINVRFISASNQQLERLVQQGQFRKDLFFRLNVIRVDIPPLRERLEDLDELVVYFASMYSERLGKNISCVRQKALDKLHQHNWPGNVRELQNIVQRAVIFSTDQCIDADHIHLDRLEGDSEQQPFDLARYFTQKFEQNVLDQSVEQVEQSLITHVLAACDNNKTHASRALGISRVTLMSKIKKYGLS